MGAELSVLFVIIAEAVIKGVMELFEQGRPSHAPEYGAPDWLPKTGVHCAVVGESGVGKSSFINGKSSRTSVLHLKCAHDSQQAVRGYLVKGQAGWAQTGVTETTMMPAAYDFPGVNAKIWDIPGAGTASFPANKYIETFGLRHFANVVIVCNDRWKEIYSEIIAELRAHNVPYFIVRTHLDKAIDANLNDQNIPANETIAAIRSDLAWRLNKLDPKASASRIYLVSCFRRFKDLGDWQKLWMDVVNDLKLAAPRK